MMIRLTIRRQNGSPPASCLVNDFHVIAFIAADGGGTLVQLTDGVVHADEDLDDIELRLLTGDNGNR